MSLTCQKSGEGEFVLKKDEKKFKLQIKVIKDELLMDIKDVQDPNSSYQKSFKADKLKEVCEDFNSQIDVLPSAYKKINGFIERNFFSLSFQEDKAAIIEIDFVTSKAKFILPRMPKVNEFQAVIEKYTKEIEERNQELIKLKRIISSYKKKIEEIPKLAKELEEREALNKNQIEEIKALKETIKEKETLCKNQTEEIKTLKGTIEERRNINDELIECRKEVELLREEIKKKDQIINDQLQARTKSINKENSLNNKEIFSNRNPDTYLKKEEVLIDQNFLKGSSIIDVWEDKLYISNFLSPTRKKVNSFLLYKASKDGDKAETFHELCDNKGATLLLIKTENEDKIVCFTQKGWIPRIQAGHEVDHDAFLMNVEIKKVNKVINPQKAIYYNKRYGPCFGNDLIIPTNFISKNNSQLLEGFSFGLKQEMYIPGTGGGEQFRVKELEAYQIILYE